MERISRIELETSAWRAEILPLNYIRNLLRIILKDLHPRVTRTVPKEHISAKIEKETFSRHVRAPSANMSQLIATNRRFCDELIPIHWKLISIYFLKIESVNSLFDSLMNIYESNLNCRSQTMTTPVGNRLRSFSYNKTLILFYFNSILFCLFYFVRKILLILFL